MNLKLLITALSAVTVLAVSSCQKSSNGVMPVTLINYSSTDPIFTRFSPAFAIANSAISLIGTNFSTDISKISVTFGGVSGTVYSSSGTEIVVGVPATAKTGNIVLVNNGITLTSASNFTVVNGTQSTFTPNYFEHVAVDGNGFIYGENNNSVLRSTTGGALTTLVNGTTANLKSIWGVAVDPSLNLYVAEQGNKRIDKIVLGVLTVFAGSGTAAYTDGTGTAAAFLTGPRGLAVDALGNLYTTDGLRVRKITPAGVVTTIAGTGVAGNTDGPAASAQFGGLEGIAVDLAGNVYVDDTFYKTIRKITPAGVVSTIAGTAGTAGFADGQGLAATFYSPLGMAIDAAGNIFVADNQYTATSVVFAIRMINKAGLVTTFMKNTYATTAAAPTTITNSVIGTATTNFPDGIAFDLSGNMYIANTGASVVSTILFK